MTKRTIEDLHSKYYGHRKFAKVVDALIEEGHNVSNIREYYEKFKFDVDGIPLEYSKDWKASAIKYIQFIRNLIR